MNITGKGLLGMVLMKALNIDYATAQETLEAIEVICHSKNIFIDIVKDEITLDDDML